MAHFKVFVLFVRGHIDSLEYFKRLEPLIRLLILLESILLFLKKINMIGNPLHILLFLQFHAQIPND